MAVKNRAPFCPSGISAGSSGFDFLRAGFNRVGLGIESRPRGLLPPRQDD